MTRINLIDPKLLTDQHLLAEYRELPRIFSKVKERIDKSKDFTDLPEDFRLGSGHMKFFYNKITFLEIRQQKIIDECLIRGIKIKLDYVDSLNIPESFSIKWEPSEEDVKISRERLKEKLYMKPSWYKYRGKSVDEKFYD